MRKGKFGQLEMDEYYKEIWTQNGKKIVGFQDLMDYLYKTVVIGEIKTLKSEI